MSRDLPVCPGPSTLPLEWPWMLHDRPDRPLDSYARFCDCDDCLVALCLQAEVEPRTPICLKTVHDRVLVDLALYCEALRGAGLESLLYVRGDRIRECFVPTDMRLRPRDQRWWSLTCHEDDELLGRRHQHRRRPRRESVGARAARRGLSAPQAAPARPPRRLSSLAEVIAPERARYRSVIAPMAEWALRSGRSVDPDLVALLLAAIDFGCHINDPTLLKRTAIYEMLWADVFNWLMLRDAVYPERVPETMWAYLDFLVQTDRLHPDSDPHAVLRQPLQCYFGLDDEGRPIVGNTDGAVDCQCFVEYAGPTHGELRRQAAVSVGTW